MTEEVRRTQLCDVHRQTAKLTVFASFEMPLWYKGIIPEHLAVRNSVGIFDISHMGRVIITGVDSERFLNYVITNDVSVLLPNSAQYSVMCNENGGIIDDFVVYRLETEKFLIVFNASNREKDYNWLIKNAEGFDVKIEGVSDDVAMFAVQGPRAEKTLQKISAEDLSKIGRFKGGHSRLTGVEAFLSRTGYTGEDGFEVFVWNAALSKPDNAVKLWNAILDAGKTFGIEPCGLGARDTLRLEAGMSLYGNDIDENTTPLEARLSFVLKFQKSNFMGKDALLEQKNEGIKRRRVGIRMIESGIPRPGFEIYDDKGEKMGYMTSGTFSPLLKCGIGMAYVKVSQAQKGNTVHVKIRKKLVKGKIVSFPFYDTEKYGYKRKVVI
ncbi:MAG: glycine cleavage system aminomethyltransferase GcvT [Candidatus Bathyarchaeota archaeon]|nr:glycine cleavage system aminomethyltransferase GcvT [Candidatus Bathyarchaeota archaeon]MDH5747167.1 glycine cleavage system aminomethyltransferase GcvT [Candidatus Bathyarchaeota archaeon]